MLDWAGSEGWNPGLDDAEAFFQADPEGFFVGVDDASEPLAAISVVNHHADFAFLGLYIVRPEHRGKGYGLRLWTHAMQHAGQRVVGLDGVEEQQQNYRTSGFAYAGGTTRYSGVVSGQSAPDIERATADDIPMLVAMEAAATGVEKPRYLGAWLEQTASRRTFVYRSDAGIAGFCTVRACRSGAKIGPLLASDTESAARLIRVAAAQFAGPVTLDVPEMATGLTQLCQGLGLQAGFKTARMYRGAFAGPPQPFFAVTSLELG